MIIKYNNISNKIIILLFAIFFLIGSITFKDYGISIDEEFQRSSGFYWLNYVLNFTSFDGLKEDVVNKIAQIKSFTLPRTRSFMGGVDRPGRRPRHFGICSIRLETVIVRR